MKCWHQCSHSACRVDFFHEITNPAAPLDEYRKSCPRCEAAQKNNKEIANDSGLLANRRIERGQGDPIPAPFNFHGNREALDMFKMACAEKTDEEELQILQFGNYR
jgi:hypothetical protein